MAGGAAVAAAAAAHRKRVQTILDAFRLADATAPDRARSLEQLGLERNDEVEEFIEQQVVVSVPRGGGWYLNESAYIAQRDAGNPQLRRVLLVVAAAIAAAIVALVSLYRGR